MNIVTLRVTQSLSSEKPIHSHQLHVSGYVASLTCRQAAMPRSQPLPAAVAHTSHHHNRTRDHDEGSALTKFSTIFIPFCVMMLSG